MPIGGFLRNALAVLQALSTCAQAMPGDVAVFPGMRKLVKIHQSSQMLVAWNTKPVEPVAEQQELA